MPAGLAWRTLPRMADREFARFQALVLRESGIALGEAKRQLLEGRLTRRVLALGLPSFGAYLELVVSDASGTELVQLLDLVSTNETHFFREPTHFEHLATQLVPRWRAEADAGRRPRRVRLWSAACSTGQEPYSLAMVLAEHLPAAEGWDVRVLATDISLRALRVAAAATWALHLAAEIPPALLRRYMLRGKGAQAGRMRAVPALRAMVAVQRLNLHRPPFAVAGPFDAIFCRNAMIYFSEAGRAAVVEQLTEHLAPDGCLYVGHAESLYRSTTRLRAVAPSIYTRAVP